jgi:hypothetical protein
VHCGLGPSDAPLQVTVTHVDGTRERFGPLEVDREHDLAFGAGSPLER